mmetsp:Transcript_101037/g.290780  ORF Transcript_101037/g.290780 Transcript_101037/m.290780 type:complete len:292 (+) Transcript_101037:373-1248(+)
MQTDTGDPHKVAVQVPHVRHIDFPVVSLPKVVHEATRWREQIPAVGEQSHSHEDLFAVEKHGKLWVVRNFTQNFRGGKREMGAPEKTPSWRRPIACQAAVPDVQNVVLVEKARAIEGGSYARRRQPITRRSERVTTPVSAKHWFSKTLGVTLGQLLAGKPIPALDESHVAVQLQVELFAGPQQLCQVPRPTRAPRMISWQLDETETAAKQLLLKDITPARQWQPTSFVGAAVGRGLPPFAGQGCQLGQRRRRQRQAVALPYKADGKQLRPRSAQKERGQGGGQFRVTICYN